MSKDRLRSEQIHGHSRLRALFGAETLRPRGRPRSSPALPRRVALHNEPHRFQTKRESAVTLKADVGFHRVLDLEGLILDFPSEET